MPDLSKGRIKPMESQMTIEFDCIKLADGSHKEGRRFVIVAPLKDDQAGINAFTEAPPGSQWKVTLVPLDEDGNAPA